MMRHLWKATEESQGDGKTRINATNCEEIEVCVTMAMEDLHSTCSPVDFRYEVIEKAYVKLMDRHYKGVIGVSKV